MTSSAKYKALQEWGDLMCDWAILAFGEERDLRLRTAGEKYLSALLFGSEAGEPSLLCQVSLIYAHCYLQYKALPALRVLSLQEIACIVQLAKKSNMFTSLDTACCLGITVTDTIMRAVANVNPSIQAMKLVHCPSITTNAFNTAYLLMHFNSNPPVSLV